MRTSWRAIDLFSGCGGLTDGLKRAGFHVVSAVEIDPLAISTYTANHPEVSVIPRDITTVNAAELSVGKGNIDLVAGCPPCQGFSRVRRRNRPEAAEDPRNDLMGEYQRLVEELNPAAVFLENVAGIERDERFQKFLARLEELDYYITWDILQLSEYGVPQRRRVVVLAGKGFSIPRPHRARKTRTVQKVIGDLSAPADSPNAALAATKEVKAQEAFCCQNGVAEAPFRSRTPWQRRTLLSSSSLPPSSPPWVARIESSSRDTCLSPMKPTSIASAIIPSASSAKIS